MEKKKIYKLISIAFALLFVIGVVWLISYYVGIHKEKEKMQEVKEEYIDELQEEVESEPSEEIVLEATVEEVAPSPLDEYPVPKKSIDFEALAKENSDIYAWITIPDTAIDYPVLQDEEELDYYLDHNLDGSSGYPGCIYTQNYNSKDWDDHNTVLYGHNMKNGSMFAALHKYKDPAFLEEHPYVYIYTDEYVLVYEIFAAYEFTDQHLLVAFDVESDEGYQAYLDSIFTNEGLGNNFREDVLVNVDTPIISLETCISNKPTNRYLVQAVLVAKDKVEALGY